MTDGSDVQVDKLGEADYEQWEPLFRAYIDFYKTTLPDEQYHNTFRRLMDPKSDLNAFVLRQSGKLVGIAHFYPHQNPWSEKPLLHLNDLFVDPQARGKGSGRKLILAVADYATSTGCERLEWDTQHHNPARKFLYDEVGVCEFVKYTRTL